MPNTSLKGHYEKYRDQNTMILLRMVSGLAMSCHTSLGGVLYPMFGGRLIPLSETVNVSEVNVNETQQN